MRKEHGPKPRSGEAYEPVEKYYIFCEGTKTEPNYFYKFQKHIASNPIYKNAIYIEIYGEGQNTTAIIEHAIEVVKSKKITNAQIWCVYDKDDFPSEDFNAVSQKAESLNKEARTAEITYNVAWSNQCFEYWFVLHFSYYTSNNDRSYYIEYLNAEFSKLKLKRYTKGADDNFDIFTYYGDPKSAIKFAKKRLTECCSLTDTNSAPATKVYLLVECLAKYLPDKVRARYISD